MADRELVDRLAALPNLDGVPRNELAWLVAHGQYELHEVGAVVAPGGEPVESLKILLSGSIAVRVDRGAGLRRVMGWRTGEVTGMLPYSRMTGPPGDNYVEEPCELLTVHVDHFPEMTRHCPVFTAYTVHLMLDRARSFNTSDLQDEKMASLGRLAAGLAHELNNPASAAARSAKLLLDGLDQAEATARALGAAGLTEEQFDAIARMRAACLATPSDRVLSPIEQADREDVIAEWLARHQADVSHAGPLADTAVTLDALDTLATITGGDTLDAALRWIAIGCQTHSLARDIEHAATRIHDLVAAVGRFTYMDSLAGPAIADVADGLRDTIRVLAAKAKAKGAAIGLEVEPDLPLVHATGGELNQIWMNLIDNALDAIADSGRIDVSARREQDRVVVRVIDDGPGIPAAVLPRIFDPFFTTKPPGQGTGLGLQIARQLVRRYRGDVTVQSRRGQTEFLVSLVAEAPAPAIDTR